MNTQKMISILIHHDHNEKRGKERKIPRRGDEWEIEYDFHRGSGYCSVPIFQEPDRVRETLVACFYTITYQ